MRNSGYELKLLVTSDLHYRLKQYDWLLEVAPHFDAVLIAGDLLDIAGHAELDAQIAVVEKYLVKLARIRPTIVSSGNHDGDSEVNEQEYVAEWLANLRASNLTVDGQSTCLGELTITSTPWNEGETSRGVIEEILVRASELGPGPWAWLYHAPPQDAPLAWTGKKFFGDPLLNELIERYTPDYVFCGHVHNAPYRENGSWNYKIGKTWCFNPGFQMGDVPCHIVLDTTARLASWNSEYGPETRGLD